MYPEIIERQDTLQRLFAQATQLQNDDEIDVEVKAGFLSYLCVKTYVYVELSVQIILIEYVKSATNDGPVGNFVNDQLRINRALKRSELLKLLGKFSQEWKQNLGEAMRGKLGDSLNSIVSIRNNISHGDDVDLSLIRLQDYYNDVQKVVELVHDVCEPLGAQADET